MSWASSDLRNINAAHDAWINSEDEGHVIHRCSNCDEPIYEGYEYCKAGGNIYCHRCYSIETAED